MNVQDGETQITGLYHLVLDHPRHRPCKECSGAALQGIRTGCQKTRAGLHRAEDLQPQLVLTNLIVIAHMDTRHHRGPLLQDSRLVYVLR
jgi:hypothetical protein